MLESCVRLLREDGSDVDASLARDAIELYTHRNEVCHAAVGSKAAKIASKQWHDLLDVDMAKLEEALSARYCHCRRNILRPLGFYRACHLDTKPTSQRKAIPEPRKTPMTNLSGIAVIQRERAFEQGGV